MERLAKEKDFSKEVEEATLKHQEMKKKARAQRFDVENYANVCERQRNEGQLMKQKCEESNQIFK